MSRKPPSLERKQALWEYLREALKPPLKVTRPRNPHTPKVRVPNVVPIRTKTFVEGWLGGMALYFHTVPPLSKTIVVVEVIHVYNTWKTNSSNHFDWLLSCINLVCAGIFI